MLEINPYSAPLPLIDENADVANVPGEAVAFSGPVTVREAYASRNLASRKERIALRFFFAFLLLVLALFVVRGLQAWVNREPGMFAIAVFGLLIPTAGAVAATVHWREQTALHRKRFGAYQDRWGYVSTGEIRQTGPSITMQIAWSAFRGYRQGKAVVMLMWKDRRAGLVFGRSQFASDDDFQRMKLIVEHQLRLID